MRIAIHCECVDGTIEERIDLGEQLPHLVVHGAAAIGALRTDTRHLCIALVEEIARSKDVRPLGVGCSLPICRELRQKIIIVCPALRTREKIVKEAARAFVILPENGSILRHSISLSLRSNIGFLYPCGSGKVSLLFPIPRRNSRTRG